LRINYQKLIPYRFEVVLGQYWDWEHIRFVHPESLGEYRIVEVGEGVAVYEQLWPKSRLGRRARSLVRQTQLAPAEILFEFLEGRHRGVRVHTVLHEQDDGTLVDETYEIPLLPDWGWLKPVVRKAVMASVDRIWDEDLRVKVCWGGWPGVPSSG